MKRISGKERIEVWNKYKREHPDPEIIPLSDAGLVIRMLDVQLEANKKDMRELFEELEEPCPHEREVNPLFQKAECPMCMKALKEKYL